MLTIYFFYGLAFIILSAVIFLLPKKDTCLGFDKSIMFLGWFGFIHGLNEWVDLFILSGKPFDVGILSLIGSLLLPLSFMFLIIFGCVTIAGIDIRLKWLNVAWIVLPILWTGLSVAFGDTLISGVLARYILCVPGTILTSLAIYLSFRKCDGQEIARPIFVGVWLSILFFLLYGVLSGMITQKAPFFPASALNYQEFINAFHLPVQLFRMICALVISYAIALILGVLPLNAYGLRAKSTIKKKLTLIITLSVAVVLSIGAALTYFAGSATLVNILGREYSQVAYTLNAYTVAAFNGNIEDAKSYVTRPLWKDAVSQSNSQYEGMSAQAIKQKLIDIDKKWITAKPEDPICKDYLDSRVSLGMKETQKARGKISELFITDKYGGLVASSGKTSDFYQADEEWWQAAYNGGLGDIYASDIEFDDSSQAWVISIAVPIRGANGEVIGICKDSIGIAELFRPLAEFKIGKTGHAVIVDNKGKTIFRKGILHEANNLISEDSLHKILSMEKPYLAMNDFLSPDKKIFLAFSEIRPPHISKRGMSWIVMVIQDMSEVYEPVRNFIIQILIIAVLMMALIVPIGSFFGKFISDPISKLHLAMERVMAGDWSYEVDIRTGDEIEEFAQTFKKMMTDIENKQRELQTLSEMLESKVEERTKELSVAQEATLNVLEDLQASKEALEETNKELMKLGELKSEFISTVSHELRTPLSIIKEGISLILDKIPGEINEKQFKILDISKYNIDRLARIIDSLLDISKIEAGKVELKRGLINISDIVRQAAKSFEAKIKDKGLEMRLDIDDATGSVWADPDRITQVLVNLIGNAVKFTNAGHIDISCKDKGDGVVCSVSDTGVGISKSDMPKVFDKFQQFGRTPGAGEKGTGLGLSIAKHIIDMHNGTIWAESELGKGTKFIFKLHKYTAQSLFREYISKALQKAAAEAGKMSIVAINFKLSGDNVSQVLSARFNGIISEVARLIKSTLRREGDDVVNSGSDIMVIISDCDKENIIRVRYRLEEIVLRYLADQKTDGAIKVHYGFATYPDDAKDDIELIGKAKAASVKA